MALEAEQDQCGEESTTVCFSSGLGLPNNMLNGGAHVGEVLGPGLSCYHSDSLKLKVKLIFPVPFCKTKYFEDGDKLLPFHAVSNIHVTAVTCLPLSDVSLLLKPSSLFFQR